MVWFFNRKHNDKSDTETVTVNGGFWSNPVFDDPVVKELYTQFLRAAGHCPECGDFLFIDIDFNDTGYSLLKYCMNRDCNYQVDISDLFNECLGIEKPMIKESDSTSNECKNPPSHYWDLNMASFMDECSRNALGERDKTGLLYHFADTGHLQRSIFDFKDVDFLPEPSEDTMNVFYKCDGAWYLTREDYDGYVWIKLDNSKITLSSYYDISKNKYVGEVYYDISKNKYIGEVEFGCNITK